MRSRASVSWWARSFSTAADRSSVSCPPFPRPSMRPIRSPLATQLDDDFLSRLRDEDLLVSSEMQAALDVCRNPQDRTAPTPRELAPQLERLAPDAESAGDPNHPLTLL